MTLHDITIPKDLAAQALAFDPVLPGPGIPAPLVSDERGQLYLQIQAPNAGQVVVNIDSDSYPCVRGEDGIWRTRYPYSSGIHFVHILIDGAEVLSPWLPIGYGYSHPCNYISLPDVDEDCYRLKAVPHGRVIRDCLYSEVTGEWQSCIIYLPAAYNEASVDPLPVLYLQHGHGENEVGWVTAGNVPLIMDNLIAEGSCRPMAVVMNNGMVQQVRNGKRIVDFLLFDDYLTQDVIPFIERRYHVGGSRQRRAMAGLSMGSLQTSITGMTHPDLFCALGIFSGFLHNWIQGSEMDMVRRGPGNDAHLAILQTPRRFNNAFEIFFRAIGSEDPLYSYFAEDDARCEAAGIRQIRRIYSGSHDWNVWRKCIRDFVPLLFRDGHAG